jgi:hypothetical protein
MADLVEEDDVRTLFFYGFIYLFIFFRNLMKLYVVQMDLVVPLDSHMLTVAILIR